MRIPFELRCQIGDSDWETMQKRDKLRAIAWAMESILMSKTTKMTKTEEYNLRALETIRRKVLRDNIVDKDD